MNLIHWMADIGEVLMSCGFIAAGVANVRCCRSAGGWLMIAGGMIGLFGTACWMVWPHVREALGYPVSQVWDGRSRILSICRLMQTAGGLLGVAGTLMMVLRLPALIAENEMLRGIRSGQDVG